MIIIDWMMGWRGKYGLDSVSFFFFSLSILFPLSILFDILFDFLSGCLCDFFVIPLLVFELEEVCFYIDSGLSLREFAGF